VAARPVDRAPDQRAPGPFRALGRTPGVSFRTAVPVATMRTGPHLVPDVETLRREPSPLTVPAPGVPGGPMYGPASAIAARKH